MKTLSASLIIEKNKLASGSPWILLLLVTLDDATVLRLAAYPEDVVFASETYSAFPMVIEPIGEAGDGNIGTLRVNVANVNRLISAYLEGDDLLGNAVIVRLVHSAHLSSSTDKIDFTYRVNRIAITDQTASFELGHEDLMRLQLPRQRFFRNRCRFIYGDEHCGAIAEGFNSTTRQDMADARTTGGPFEKLHGWWIHDPWACTVCDAGITLDGALTMKNITGAVKEWYDSLSSAVFAYQEISDDFDTETLLLTAESSFTSKGLWAYFLVQSTHNPGYRNWFGYAWTCDSATGNTSGRSLWTVASSTNETTQAWYPYLRLVRTGNTVVMYGKTTGGGAWTSFASQAVASWSTPLRVGFVVASRLTSTAVTTVQWDYLHRDSGGLATCDYTLDGPNGCRVHKNTVNFGGFPSIPTGRLYGI